MGMFPIDDTTWVQQKEIGNGENADSLNLNRAVKSLRLEVKELWNGMFGGATESGIDGADATLLNNQMIDGGDTTVFSDPV